MTFTEALQLKERFLKFEDLRALDYCEKRWLEENRPLNRWEVFNFIEKMLQELKGNGIGYPKVLLLRKKEIQRQQFTVRQPEDPSADVCTCAGGWLLNRQAMPMPQGRPAPRSTAEMGNAGISGNCSQTRDDNANAWRAIRTPHC